MTERAGGGDTPYGSEPVALLTAAEALAIYEVMQRHLAAEHDHEAYGRGWAKLRAAAQAASA